MSPGFKLQPSEVGLDLFVFYVALNSQGYIATGSLQVEETSAYCTVNHRASASNYQLSNMKHPARDSNRQPQRLEARTLTATPPSPLPSEVGGKFLTNVPPWSLGVFPSYRCTQWQLLDLVLTIWCQCPGSHIRVWLFTNS